MNNIKTSAVICAAGSGSRMRAGKNKVLLNLGSHPVLYYTLKIFEASSIEEIVIVTSTESIDDCIALVSNYGFTKVGAIILGGKTRQESVYLGLVQTHGDIIAIHDGARPLVKSDDINISIEQARSYGAAALGMPCKDTIKVLDDNGFVVKTLERDALSCIATPQVFKRDLILSAHKAIIKDNIPVTDDCAAVEYIGHKVKIITSSSENIKLTTPEDMIIAENILKQRGALE